VTLRLDAHLMHAVIDSALVGTWPCPSARPRSVASSAHETPSTPVPLPPLRPGSPRTQRKCTQAAAAWSPARTSISVRATAAKSSPSSSRTRTYVSCTAKKCSTVATLLKPVPLAGDTAAWVDAHIPAHDDGELANNGLLGGARSFYSYGSSLYTVITG
jgi:hypothetical protein